MQVNHISNGTNFGATITQNAVNQIIETRSKKDGSIMKNGRATSLAYYLSNAGGSDMEVAAVFPSGDKHVMAVSYKNLKTSGIRDVYVDLPREYKVADVKKALDKLQISRVKELLKTTPKRLMKEISRIKL